MSRARDADARLLTETKDAGRTYLFHLHKGITFHDGTPAHAEAIR